ncbi:SIR2 family protein [Bacillus cereus]|uniref:SIR2 family protein n=1 Tax=Bacillus cereus TaxID=1396 RepID=UPI003CFE83B3
MVEKFELPDINKYEDIIKAAKTGNLIIFVGAGVSRLLELPSWYGYALEMLTDAVEKGVIEAEMYEQLKKEDPKKILTICKMLFDEKKISPKSAKELFKFEKNEKYKAIYEKLYSMKAIYITTNYDECLDVLATPQSDNENFISSMDLGEKSKFAEQSSEKKVVIDHKELLEAELKNGNVIHIHGSVKNEESMLVTVQDYLKRYGTNSKQSHPEVSVFLEQVFNSNYVVLFLGYGLEEFEILEYMLSKTNNPGHTMTHYMLFPTNKEKHKMTDLYGKYYSSFGVELIPYDTSGNRYDRLIHIIDEWSKVLGEVSGGKDFISKTRFIDDVMKCDDAVFEVRYKSVIKEIETSEALALYFFKNVNGKRWLKKLANAGFFDPEDVPQPKKVENGYRIPYWEQGEYLRKLVNQHDLTDEDIGDILEIIKSISFYRNKEEMYIDNYRVWNQFVEVLEKIPNKYINIEFLDTINIWTKSMFSVDYISYNIGGKLVQKFLNSPEPEDIKKAEKIIECLVSLDFEKNQVKLGKNYFYKIFTYDTVQKIAEKCSMQLLKTIMQQLKEFLGKSEGKIEFKYDGKSYTLEIAKIKKEYITRIVEHEIIKHENSIEGNEIESFTEQVTKWLYTKFSKDKLYSKIEADIQSIYNDINYKQILSLQYETRNSYNNGFELILYFFKDLCKYKKGPQMELFLDELIDQEYLLFTKIVLDAIGNDFVNYNKKFWNILEQREGTIVFQEYYLESELKVILEQLENLNSDQERILLYLIEKVPNGIIDRDIDVWKQKRLKALRHIPSFEKLYLKLKEKTKVDPALSSKAKVTKSKFVRPVSPLSQEELLKMSNNEIAKYLREYKESKHGNITTVYSLGQAIREFSEENPAKMVKGLKHFINTDYYYIYQIIFGLCDAWKEQKFMDWDKLLNFISSYMNRTEFWHGELLVNKNERDYDYKSVIIIVCRLFGTGSEYKEWAFNQEHYNKAKKILLMIFKKNIDLEECNLSDNSISYFLNSVKGNVLEALLKMSVLNKNMEWENKWDNDFNSIYNEYLELNVGEAYSLMGMELANFLDLDRKWTIDRINSIKLKSESWEAFFEGYSNNLIINEDIYILMKKHYESAIDYSFKEKEIKTRLANVLAEVYLRGYEKEVEKTLYNKVIVAWNYDLIKEFIYAFCRIENDKLKEDEKQRIFDFWKEIHHKYNGYGTKDFSRQDKKLLSKSILLTSKFDDIDETNRDLIKLAIPFVDNDFDVVIELLYVKIKETDNINKRKIIGELVELLVSDLTPLKYCPEEEILYLIEYLYAAQDKKLFELTNQVCNKFVENDFNFLREIYIKNNN